MAQAGLLIADFVNKNVAFLQSERQGIVDRITEDVGRENNINILRVRLQEYMVQKETKEIDQTLARIAEFRK